MAETGGLVQDASVLGQGQSVSAERQESVFEEAMASLRSQRDHTAGGVWRLSVIVDRICGPVPQEVGPAGVEDNVNPSAAPYNQRIDEVTDALSVSNAKFAELLDRLERF